MRVRFIVEVDANINDYELDEFCDDVEELLEYNLIVDIDGESYVYGNLINEITEL